jgi:ribosomal-protein-alanine N-acetyltransferase
MKIRSALSVDAQEIAKVESEAHQQEAAATLEDFREYLSDPQKQQTILVAENDGIVAGFLGYTIQDKYRVYIWDIAVRQNQQLRGIATSLLTVLINKAAAQSMRSVFLKVSDENIPAHRLYGRFNFVLKDRLKNYYGHSRDAFVLELIL